jgi:hypothetical protein
VIDVSNRPHIHVRLTTIKFFLRHEFPLSTACAPQFLRGF